MIRVYPHIFCFWFTEPLISILVLIQDFQCFSLTTFRSDILFAASIEFFVGINDICKIIIEFRIELESIDIKLIKKVSFNLFSVQGIRIITFTSQKLHVHLDRAIFFNSIIFHRLLIIHRLTYITEILLSYWYSLL